MRRKPSDLSVQMHAKSIEALFVAAEGAVANKRIGNFLRELLTESEQLMLGRRLLIAQLLLSGVTQVEIRQKLKVSPNTIWKAKKWLLGQFPEYGKILKNVEADRKAHSTDTSEKKQLHHDSLSFKSLKKKYPMHFLLFNLADELLKLK